MQLSVRVPLQDPSKTWDKPKNPQQPTDWQKRIAKGTHCSRRGSAALSGTPVDGSPVSIFEGRVSVRITPGGEGRGRGWRRGAPGEFPIMQLHCVTGIKPDDASVSPGSVGKNGESGLELTGFDGASQNCRRPSHSCAAWQ